MVTLDMAGMVAGSKYRGEFEERMKNVINEVRNDGQTLLFIDELHTLVDAGGADGAMNASNILKPCLARGELQIDRSNYYWMSTESTSKRMLLLREDFSLLW